MSLPTPVGTPPPSSLQPSISAEINVATRKQHTELNRLIIDRLPLALPPHASNPGLLVQGLEPFALIIHSFEYSWAHLEKSLQAKIEAATSSHDAAVLAWLANLRPRGLERTPRLRKDSQHMADIAGGSVLRAGPLLQPKLDSYALREKPHVLIAYAWVFYMAIFSGGRWVRQQLANAGPEFWRADPGSVITEKGVQETPGFTFLCFDGDEDGEDIKTQFKGRLAEAESLLTIEERRDVVEEAQKLFELCISTVHAVDRAIWRRKIRLWTAITSVVILAILVFAWLCGFSL